MSTRGKKRSSPRKKETMDVEEGKAESFSAATPHKKVKTAQIRQNLLSLFMKTPLDEHLPRATVAQVPHHMSNEVMVVRISDPLPQVFQRLTTEGFLSAPVVDEKNKYVGYVDMLDLVRATTDMFSGETEERWIDWWGKEDDFCNQLVLDVIIRHKNRGPSMLSDNTSFSALEALARSAKHRVTVVDDENKVTGILTNSMIISWLRQNKELYGDLRTMLVKDMIVDQPKELVTIKETENALQAFLLMSEQKVSGIAVVDAEGLLTGNISLRDLRGVGTSGQHFFRLYTPIKEFKAIARRDFPAQAPESHYTKKKVPAAAYYVTAEQTFDDVIDMMNDGNLHRIYVCEERPDESKPFPINVITQTDICRIVLKYIISQSEPE